MKLISWNVNGLRACMGKGFMEFFNETEADIFCLQETKLQEGQISLELPGYHQYWNYAEKKGYSGTAVFTKEEPLSVTYGIGIEEHDHEGRVITLEFPEFYVTTVYTPNSQRELTRLAYRMQWEDDFLRFIKKLEEKKRERRQQELVQALVLDYSLVWFFDLDTGMGVPVRNDDSGHMLDDAFSGEMSLEESMGLYIRKFVQADDRDMLWQAVAREKLREELAEKKTYYVNYRVMKDGKVKYFQMKAVRAGLWEEGHGIVLGFHSVDEETRNEMEKKSLLEDALSQAKRASKAKSIFLSNMSHDIRTPMNAIVGFTTLAIAHIDHRDQVEEYLKKIKTSGDHLLSLINDVLDMSRIESGKIHLEEKLCSLPEILHGLCNILQADIHAKQLELRIDTVDVFDEEIYCDKLRLNQVLLNLVSNSVKYTGAGGIINIRITEKAGAPEGYGYYEFLIRDSGIGMSEEFVAHIFEPFERERNSTISGIQGTGLGMAITKNIVNGKRVQPPAGFRGQGLGWPLPRILWI